MRGVNKVIIIGNLGADPEARQFNNGSSVTNISVATSEQWTDKQSGEKREDTQWHRISLFNRLGEIAAQYLRKGSKVYIEGSLRTRKYQDQSGQDRYVTEIRAEQMQMLDGAGDNNGQQNNGGQYNQSQGQGHQNNGGQYNQSQGQGQQNNGGQYNQQQNNNYPRNDAPAPQTYNAPPSQGNQQQFNNKTTAATNSAGNGGAPTDDDIPFAPFYAGV